MVTINNTDVSVTSCYGVGMFCPASLNLCSPKRGTFIFHFLQLVVLVPVMMGACVSQTNRLVSTAVMMMLTLLTNNGDHGDDEPSRPN